MTAASNVPMVKSCDTVHRPRQNMFRSLALQTWPKYLSHFESIPFTELTWGWQNQFRAAHFLTGPGGQDSGANSCIGFSCEALQCWIRGRVFELSFLKKSSANAEFLKNAGNFFQVALVVRVPVLSEQMISARWWAELCRHDATCTALWVRRLRSSSYDHTECCLALWVLHTFTFTFYSNYIFLHLSTVIYRVPTGRSKIFQEAVVQPSVSTDGNFLTMAFFLAISEVPGKRLEAAWSFILTTHCPGLGKRPTSVKSQHHAQECRKCQKCIQSPSLRIKTMP